MTNPIASVEAELASKSKALVKPKRGHNLKGRPKGAKNKTTIFKEIMHEGFEESMAKDFIKVIEVVVNQAKAGDMKAAKMLFDRVIPVSKAVDLESLGKKGISITINVGEMDEDMGWATSTAMKRYILQGFILSHGPTRSNPTRPGACSGRSDPPCEKQSNTTAPR